MAASPSKALTSRGAPAPADNVPQMKYESGGQYGRRYRMGRAREGGAQRQHQHDPGGDQQSDIGETHGPAQSGESRQHYNLHDDHKQDEVDHSS